MSKLLDIFRISLVVISTGLFLTSCSSNPISYGVVLWGDGRQLVPSGIVIEVMQDSEIEKVFRFRLPGGDNQAPLISIPRWRVRDFVDSQEAYNFSTKYKSFSNMYGYASRQGLPLRATESATANILYKLKEGQLVKIIDRSTEPVKIGNFENYWYLVLTEDGIEGYSYGEYLPVFESSGDPIAEVADLRSADPVLQRILSTVWRPEYYLKMIQSNRFDLNKFSIIYGLFPDPVAQQFELIAEAETYTFPYTAMERVKENTYVLRLLNVENSEESTPVRIKITPQERVAVSYVSDGRLVTKVFVDLEGKVSEIIAQERRRRDFLFDEFFRRSKILSSNGYGQIILNENRKFMWTGYQKLVPSLLPRELIGDGEIDFKFSISNDLAQLYDGSLTFKFFNGSKAPVELTVLFVFDEKGVRFTPAIIDQNQIEITRISRKAFVMFFSFGELDPSKLMINEKLLQDATRILD